MIISLFIACKKDTITPKDPEVTVDPNASLKDGLVAYYPFNGNVNDVSGNNLNGTIVGNVSYVKNRYFENEKCIQLSGNNSYVKITDDPKLQLKQKMSVYIEFMPEDNNPGTLIGKRDYNVGPQSWAISVNYLSPAQFSVIKSGKCSNSNITADWSYGFSEAASPVITGCWNYIAAIFDGTSQKIYLNGKLVLNAPVTFGEMAGCAGTEMRFGNWWSTDPVSFKGKLDEIRIYNRVLTFAEIEKLYKFD